ncbi:arginine--tRNA ligase [Zeimonas arvi]|uniref:Arginine--tRNA ligase n=1 Tax=Zeimonas arvi TaxID=2498847 RepID=A0A5C8NSN7_9BURK|nr:arginine--tRNA ligase [Zeimonas arvi]TXL64167.1 arginine--tRNA ligase [Zeimonas arvi]
MLKEQKSRLAALFAQAASELAARAGVEQAQVAAEVTLERPKQAAHGDLACNLAMQLAKPLKAPPRKIAEQLVERVRELDRDCSTDDGAIAPPHTQAAMIEALEIAGPGFINIRLRDDAKRAAVPQVLADGGAFGRGTRGAGRPVIVEFVSANPTGPLHVGHGRQGALGDALSALLEADGWTVTREFYYNDAGAQIDNLARSVQARARGLTPEDPSFPADGYRGDYIVDIANDYLARATVSAERVPEVTGAGDPEDLEAIRRFAVACLRREQDLDLRAFGVRFDNYYLESSLYADGRVQQAVDTLVAAGKTYEDGGALWLRTTGYGDDKDRVMRKSEGGYTYFVPDVAYHVTKWERGFQRAINIQGSDHHGTIARVRAGLQALGVGIPAGYPDYVLHKMVTVMRGGEEVKISKRAGSYVTLRDLITWSGEQRDEAGQATGSDEQRGRDAVRFFLISRKADSEFVFDVDLALSRSDENPVYYVQYAHARLCSVLAQWGGDADALAASAADGRIDLSPLAAPREFALIARLAEFPERVAEAVDELAPHAIAFYLKDLAAEVHSYYNAERFLVDDEALRNARLALVLAARQVLRNGLALIGVSAPERM